MVTTIDMYHRMWRVYNDKVGGDADEDKVAKALLAAAIVVLRDNPANDIYHDVTQSDLPLDMEIT